MAEVINSIEKVAPAIDGEQKAVHIPTCRYSLNQIGVQTNSPICWSPDGVQFCYVNGAHGITICERNAEGRFVRVQRLYGHKYTVCAMKYHPTKKILVSCGNEGIFIWDLEKYACKKVINEATDKNAHEGEVECLEWVGNAGVLATGGRDSTIKLWKVDSDFSFLETIAAHKSSVNALVACDKEMYLASAGRDSAINLWTTKTLMPDTIDKRIDDKGIACVLIAAMDGHLGDVCTLTTSSDGAYIFSGARDNTVRAWDFKQHHCVREVKDHNQLMGMHKGDVDGLFCINQNQFLLSFSADGTMHLFKLGSLEGASKLDDNLSFTSLDELLKGFTADEQETTTVNDDLLANVTLFQHDGVAAAALNPANPLLAVASTSNTVQIHDISRAITQPRLIQEFVSHSLAVTAISPLSIDLVSASEDGTVNIFDPRGNRALSFQTGCAVETVETMGDLIFAGGKDYKVHCFSSNFPRFYQALAQQAQISGIPAAPASFNLFEMTGHAGKIRSLAVSSGLRSVFTAGEDGVVMRHAIPEMKPVDVSHEGHVESSSGEESVRDHDGAVLSVAVSDDLGGVWYVCSGGNDYALYVYAVSEGSGMKRAWNQSRAHDGVVTCVAMGHGGCADRVVSGGWDCKVKVWNLRSGDCEKELETHSKRIAGVAISPDGHYLVSAAADKSILLYDVMQDYKVIARYESMDDCRCVCFVNNQVAAGYASGVIRMWPIPEEGNKNMFE